MCCSAKVALVTCEGGVVVRGGRVDDVHVAVSAAVGDVVVCVRARAAVFG